jgi:cellobiose transport system permease protein
MMMSDIGWGGKLESVIFPTLVGAFGVFFMRQYLLEALPYELIEAAKVDGASNIRIVWSVVLPVARPAMMVLGMLTFVQAWNDFFWPFLALNQENPTVQVALGQLSASYTPDQSIVMAGALISTLPLLLVFVIFGKQIVGGIMSGAVKG